MYHDLKHYVCGCYNITPAAPGNPTEDVLSVIGYGCDAVVFLVFNKFNSDCKTQTYGHEFGGLSQGGMCEQHQGRGYTIVVDQVRHTFLFPHYH